MISVKRGPELYATLSTIQFDKWGSKTNLAVTVTDDPADVESGQVFDNWPGAPVMTVNESNKAEWFALCKPYLDLAENQLWVLNNEPVRLLEGSRLVMPGAGLYWLANIVQPEVRSICIVDISRQQVKFCTTLWQQWDGVGYGEFAWNYIQHHNLQHYELDIADLDPASRLRLRKRENFVTYVNKQFEKQLPNFQEEWLQAQRYKQVTAQQASLVDWVLSNDLDQVDAIWQSNILDYKWTLMHHTEKQIAEYENAIKSKHL
jgi:hypothetical protein